MKSQNDKYHGDEHITDKPQRYVVRMSEVVSYEVEVEAFDEEEAQELAIQELVDDYNGTYVVDQTGFQTDRVDIIQDIKVGGTD
jgi:uncharacterized Zn ribbon protein